MPKTEPMTLIYNFLETFIFETKKFLLKKCIFIYYFDCILRGSKFINVIAFRIVNIYLCLLLGNLSKCGF